MLGKAMDDVNITVVIPTYNRCNLLRKALESIAAQDYPVEKFEVIVVDNGSSDRTKEVVFGHQWNFNLIYNYDSNPGLHVGRNSAVSLARGDIITYADDDIRAFPRWLSTLADVFEQDDSIGLVGGNNLPLFESEQPDWFNELWQETEHGRFITEYSLIDFHSLQSEIPSDFVFGCNYSIRKNILEHIGGFHPDGMPQKYIFYRGDGETFVSRMVWKLGFKVVFHPEVSVYHTVSTERMTREYIAKRSYNAGISDSYSDIRNKGYVLLSELLTMKSRGDNQVLADLESQPLDMIRKRYYRAGYYAHHLGAYKHPNLLSWILQEHYRDEMRVFKL